jgi:hypothetical protein
MLGWLRGGDAGGVATAEAARDDEHATLPWDGVPWAFAQPADGVVAVGDLQGDLVGLDAILRLCGMADARGDWCGRSRHLVLAGDLVGGCDDARLLVAFVQRLEAQAARAGGRVHALLGNHDVLPAQGEVGKWTRGERRAWRDHPGEGAGEGPARDAFRGDGPAAKWLRSRNALVRIGDTLFAHAGVGPWLEHADPGAVNATIRAWIAHWQGTADAPPAATRWTAGVPGMARESRFACGPLWTRAFKPDGSRRARGAPARAELAAWLAQHGAARLAIGHAPVDGGAIATAHPYYGDLVAMLDTRIVDARHGGLSALCIDARGVRALRFAAECRDRGCRKRERQRLAAAPRRGWLARMFAALLRWLRRRDKIARP